jgi:hypothetical protein
MAPKEGLKPTTPRVGRRAAPRAAPIGAERHRRKIRGKCGCIAAGRAAGSAAEIEGVAGDAVERAVGDALGGELGAVADPHDDRPGPPQPRHCNGVLRRNVIGKQARALGDAAPDDPDVVLDDDWYAGQGEGRDLLRNEGAHPPCLLSCRLGIEIDQGVEQRVSRLDVGDEGIRHRHGVEPAGVDLAGNRTRIVLIERIHGEEPLSSRAVASKVNTARAASASASDEKCANSSDQSRSQHKAGVARRQNGAGGLRDAA